MTELAPDPELFATADEAATLHSFLEYYRAVFVRKMEGIDEVQARRTLPPSELTLLGLARHMAEVERGWFRRRFADQEAPFLFCGDAVDGGDPDGDFHPAPDDTMAAALAALQAEIEFAREVSASVPVHTLAAGDPPGQRIPGWRPSLRWVVVHMVEEYARHCGHADLLREAVDGATGD